MAQSFEGWWASQGRFTKNMLLLILFITLSGSLQFIDPRLYILDFTMAFKYFHIWRLITNFFFFGLLGPGALNLLISVYLFQMYANRLEKEDFQGKPAEYVWLWLVTMPVMLLIGGWLFGLKVLSHSAMLMVIWVWCRFNPEQNLSIMGVFSVSAINFPWVLLGLHWVLGQGWMPDAVGILAGHFYIYFRTIFPNVYGYDFLATPQLLKQYLPEQRIMGGIGGTAVMRPMEPTSAPTRSWGPGRTLGSG